MRYMALLASLMNKLSGQEGPRLHTMCMEISSSFNVGVYLSNHIFIYPFNTFTQCTKLFLLAPECEPRHSGLEIGTWNLLTDRLTYLSF